MDKLGNRDQVHTRDGNNVDYVIDDLTNRYDSVGGSTLTYDAAGNLTKDKQGYQYYYDYENRIIKIAKNGQTKAEFTYDALGRRVKKTDSITSVNTRCYYYNYNWQILSEFDGSGAYKKSYIYGNYIDEVLMSVGTIFVSTHKYYLHDHLYSPVALTDNDGVVVERYEYDAYGKCYILEPNFAPDPDGKSDVGNPYAFQGKQLDFFDNGNLKLMTWPYRNYCTYTGRWLQAEKRGLVPNDGKFNPFAPCSQYTDGMNYYEAFASDPVTNMDIYALNLTQGSSGCDCIEKLRTAVRMASRALTRGKCKDWFTSRGYSGEIYRVNLRLPCHPVCLAGVLMWTWPLSRDISVCPAACDDDLDTIALLLLHEVAHHYCTMFWFWGREDCANSAMEACVDDVRGI